MSLHSFYLHPLLILLLTISLGYFVGKLKYKNFKLGGIAGSLLVGILLGQFRVEINHWVSDFFFALFIYAIGYQGGGTFFKSLNKRTLLELISGTLNCIFGLVVVLIFAKFFDLDRGMASGMAAGALTQSAMLGSADDAISHLSISSSVMRTLQANTAVGYAITYLFGSFGTILLLSGVFPALMGWDIRKEAVSLAADHGDGAIPLEPGQFNALHDIRTRIYEIQEGSKAIGKTAQDLYKDKPSHIALEAIFRGGKVLDFNAEEKVASGDVVAITAEATSLLSLPEWLGKEVTKPKGMKLVKEEKGIVISNRDFVGLTLAEFRKKLSETCCFGLFVQKITRLGDDLPLVGTLKTKRGDEVTFIGTPNHIAEAVKLLGAAVPSQSLTDFVFFGLGMAMGFLLGLCGFPILGIDLQFGSGVGCLISGLAFGWFRSIKPRYGNLPMGASNFLREFGLAVFVASIGLTAGPEAVDAIRSHGVQLFVLGAFVTIIPLVLTFFISYYLLRIQNPVRLLSTLAGGMTANPAFAAILEKAGNATPVIPFTPTYILANVWLTIWGPVIVAFVTKN